MKEPEQVGKHGDELQVRQLLLHQLTVLAHQQETQHVQHLHPVHQVVCEAVGGVGKASSHG